MKPRIPGAGRFLKWWRLPFWVLALATGAKSFADNPVLGSRRLNRAGLHSARIRLAHALAWRRRRALAARVPSDWRERFDRDGFVLLPDFLAPEAFARLRSAILDREWESRQHQQGDTFTRRVAIGPEMLRDVPQLHTMLSDPRLNGLFDYISTGRSQPIFYVQTIVGGAADGPPDPQVALHSDTFHPSLKAWLFLTDVGECDRPLTYVPGSHRLSESRIAWEQRKSCSVLDGGDRLSQRGSLRIEQSELAELGLGEPRRFAVAANTLVAADTCGFHARADSDRPTLRVEIWAYARRTPFLPLIGPALPFSRRLAPRRAQWLYRTLDLLDRLGLRKQHWQKAGSMRPIDP